MSSIIAYLQLVIHKLQMNTGQLAPGLLLVAIALLCSHVHGSQTSEDVETFEVSRNESLTAALEAIQQYIANGSGGYFELLIASDIYTLDSTALATFKNISNISIIGAEAGTTVINCEGRAGWVFTSVNVMTIANITFHNCSSRQNSTSTNASQPGNLSFIEFSSALYLLECSHLQLEDVAISNSPGVGLAMFNIRGRNFFSNSNFTNNPPYSERARVHGTGGVILEFSYCHPGDVECNSTNVVEVTGASFEFTNCMFESNIASSIEFIPPRIYPHGAEHWGFGKGGGLAVYFKGRALNNSVTLKNCLISYNVAEYSGGGLYVEFGDKSQNNTFNFTRINSGLSSIETNGNWCGVPSFNQRDKEYSGGGAKIVFMYYPPDGTVRPGYHTNVTGNHVEFNGNYFVNNMGCFGGGAAVVSSRADPSTSQTNTVHFKNCMFGANKAIDASALGFSVLQPDTSIKGQLITPIVEDCVFDKNSANSRSQHSNPNIAGYEFGIGALYIDEVPVNFTGTNNFTRNTGTGLVVCDANVLVSLHSSLHFNENNGRRGGALVVTGSGAIFVYPGVVLNFTENQAWEIGGAIYTVGHFGERKFIYEEKCFVRFHKPTVHPKDWNASFIFSNNSVAGISGNGSIYTTSLLACVWPDRGNTTSDIEQALCWPGWVYEGRNGTSTCTRYIDTAPASFNLSGGVYHLKLYPGHSALLPVQMRDDSDKVLTSVVFKLMPSPDPTTEKFAETALYVTDNKISISGVTSATNEREFSLETLGPRVLSTTLNITILPCPPGFTPLYASDTRMVAKCKCGYSLYFSCSSSNLSSLIQPGYCISYDSMNASCRNSGSTAQSNSSTHHHGMIVVKCPATAKVTDPIPLPREHTCDFEKDFCGQFHRDGKFCSSCMPGYAIDVNDINECVRCDKESYHYGWFLYILTNLVPITIFYAIVAIFKVSATSAPMYAFVFFAQITTVRYFHNQFPWIYGLAEQKHYTILRPILLAPYCIWNLDFFVFNQEICLSHSLTNLSSLLLQYLLAFYPMVLILLSYLCIELYDRNFKPLVWLWTPFRACLIKIRRSWQPKTSIIDAFATFLMLSYTKITFTTISLLTPAQPYYVYHKNETAAGDLVFYFDPQYKYFQGPHLPMGLLALVVGVVFVLTPPVFLFLYPTRIFQRCLNRSGRSLQALHTFADAFHGCFKNRTNNNRDYRYFAGLYLVLRIVILVVYALEVPLYKQLLLQQILCILAVLLFALVKPYKELFYNKVDLVFFSLLSLMNIFGFSNYTYSILNENKPSTALFAITYALGFIPLIYISVFVFYLFLKWRGFVFLKWRGFVGADPIVKESTIGGSNVSLTADENSVDDVPDRLLNPQNYPNNGTPVMSVNSINSGASSNDSGNNRQETEEKPPRMRATEGSYFLKKARYMKNYSSM